jgi:hypothetical protein
VKCLAKLLDSILNRLAPLPDLGSDWLADYEAEEESTSPGALYRDAIRRRWETAPVDLDCPGCAALFPEGWEDQLHDACADECDDEDPAPRPAPTVPVGTLLNLIAKTLRDNDVRPYLVPAQMVEQAINLNYRITPR